ncbi:integral membrane protein [Pilimelia terevasa]|uniref:Integral membrane protein n=1 Tax=Pilimelia terevasa TaxID=53372 RepID=A0A8J3FHX0_9ACTN|nr:DoxX family protein [Pilimelia terevasa]GGK27628.1 integral membrane protein [Pilimelia terevasa]
MAHSRLTDVIHSLFRVVIGLLFAFHGAAKLFGLFGSKTAQLGHWPGWWAGLIELVTGLLVLVGLFTRPAAILASGTMAYAYFVVHQPAALLPMQNRGETAALYCWIFLLIAAIGPGAYALDRYLPDLRATATRHRQART